MYFVFLKAIVTFITIIIKIEAMDPFNKYTLSLFFFLFPALCNAQSILKSQIGSVIKCRKAKVGVCVINQQGDAVTVNNRIHYPMMSVMKFHEALALLNKMNAKKILLDTEILIRPSDLFPKTYSPMYQKYGNKKIFSLPIKDVLKYSISYSDNNACDILFRYIGGPQVVCNYIHNLGFKNIVIKVNEQNMYDNPQCVYKNWSTPLATAQVLRFFLLNKLFDDSYKDYLRKIMEDTTTGADKIKGLLPKNIIVGHKTGSAERDESGLKAGDNDLGFVYLPNGKFYVIVVFVKDSKEDDKTNAQIIAQISKLVYDYEKNL